MKPKSNKPLYFIIAVLVLAIIGLVVQNQIVLKKTQEQTQQIAQKAEINQDYVIQKISEQAGMEEKTPTYIKQLTKAEAEELIQKYPAIYNGTQPGYFDVRYEDRWIIYDAVNENIVKDIVVQGMKIE
jgi:hypothetical protein